MQKKYFGTDGIRGKANEFPLVPEFITKLARGVVSILKLKEGEHVVVGLDTRLSGVMLEAALTAGFLSEGINVHHLGVVSTPVTAFVTKNSNTSAGIMLTASHNPFEDNGIKIFTADGYKLSDQQEAELEAYLDAEHKVDYKAVALSMSAERPEEAYFDKLTSLVGETSLEGMKVVVDCANGANFFSAPDFFQSLGIEVIPMAIEPDGKNINQNCGAVHPEEAAKLVMQHKADLGVCFDGDGDRLIMIDENGEVISGDKILCIAALAMKRRGELKNDTLVATVMSNLGLRDALEKEGIALETTGVGDKLVLERMREKGFSLGGENSGHIIFSDYTTTGDGLLSALLMILEIKNCGKKLSQLAECMDEYPQQLTNLPVSSKPPISDVPALKDCIDLAEQELGDSGRILVRYSGTENKIRVLVEAKEQDLVDKYTKVLSEAVQKELGN